MEIHIFLKCFINIICILKIMPLVIADINFEIKTCIQESNNTWTCNYIPKTIPIEITNIRVVNSEQVTVVTPDSFNDESWTRVLSLEFTDDPLTLQLMTVFSQNCFQNLHSLRELKIHKWAFDFSSTDPFAGLHYLQNLDMTGCFRLTLRNITELLYYSDVLPSLQSLIISNIGSLRKIPTNLDKNFFTVLGTRNITHLDLSNLNIDVFDMTAMFVELPLLRSLNVSFSQIGTIIHDYGKRKLNHLRLFDISYAMLHKRIFGFPPGKVTISNLNLSLASKENFLQVLLLYPKVMNISGLLNVQPHTTIWLKNITFLLNENPEWKTHELILKNNGIKYLDLQIVCNNSMFFTSLENIDLSANGLEMINPTVFSCMTALETVDLSNNQLGIMATNLPKMWENLLTNVHSLRYINLSNNNIISVPPQMFTNIPNIETIDLSENELQQIRFTLKPLHRLRHLNLAFNRIKILDENSLRILNNFQHHSNNNSIHLTIPLDGNPLDCSSCESKSSISWILSSKPPSVSVERLKCQNEDGNIVQLDQAVAKEVNSICQRHIYILIAIICSCTGTFVIVVSTISAYKCRQKIKARRNRENVILNLNRGEGRYEFAVFLSFSSRDEEFVDKNIIGNFNERLMTITGVDRCLVCTGDMHFRPGRAVLDEMIRCFERASVLVVVVSDGFCQSAYCQNELAFAFERRMPILLILKDQVDEALMTPTILDLYQRTVRIICTEENGQFVVTPPWEQICEAVLDKIQSEQ